MKEGKTLWRHPMLHRCCICHSCPLAVFNCLVPDLALCVVNSRQALEAMTTARDQLAAVAQQLDVRVQAMHVQTMQLPQLQQELITLQELHQRMQKDQQLQSQVCTVAV